MASARDFFTTDQAKQIEEAIVKAEKNTSGEIRVHIEDNCPGEVLTRAAEVFAKLGMNKTAQQNGVLFYLAVSDQKFAILGDAGINKVVPANFWDTIRDNMMARFSYGHFTEGICEGIEGAGEQLKAHFPYQADDKDELSNEVTFDQ
jgi:uncharacterized membrane protein